MGEDIVTAKPVHRMSKCGSCPKALSAEKLGYPSIPLPEFVSKAAEEGKKHEEWMIEDLIEEGYAIEYRQLEIILDYTSYILKGHIECIIWWPFLSENSLNLHPLECYLFEAKSMSQFEFQRWMKGRFLEFPNYGDQITAYWEEVKKWISRATEHLTKGIVYFVKNRSSGYIDKQVLNYPPSDFNLIRAKLDAVEISVAEDKLYEADFDPSSIECKRCGFRDSICKTTKEELLPATQLILSRAVDMCREGIALKKQGEDFYKEGKKVLENHAEAISPEKKYIYDIDNMHISRFNVRRVSYPKETIESAFDYSVYVGLQKVSEYWQTNLTDLRERIENGE